MQSTRGSESKHGRVKSILRITAVLPLIIAFLASVAGSQAAARDTEKAGDLVSEAHSAFPNPPEAFTIRSRILAEDRQIWVQLPAGYAISDERYPVVFVLDAEWLFHLAAAHARYYAFDEVTDEEIPRMIVVGIPNTDRDRDYTPTTHSGIEHVFTTAGKAADFLRFLKQELIPTIDRRYRTQPGRAIVGWSFSGLFSAYAALEEPDLFSAHLCISPAIWWDDQWVYERMLTARFDHPKRMVFTLGGGEKGGYVYEATKRLLKRLEEHPVPGLSVQHFEFEQVGHTWGVASALNQGLQWLFGDYIAPDEVIAGGMDAVDAYYKDLSRRWGYTVAPHSRVLRAVAEKEWAAGHHDAAIGILAAALESNPNDPFTHFDLGADYKALGKTDAALKCTNDAIQAEKRKPVPNEVNLRYFRETITELSEATSSQ